MDLREYKFKPNHWPPPSDRKDKDTYLLGFDEDNQPYIVRWESEPGEEGWVATTLCENKASKSTAVPRSYSWDSVGKIIQFWADAPMLMRSVFKAQAEHKRKRERDED